jgi:hypothetical protein
MKTFNICQAALRNEKMASLVVGFAMQRTSNSNPRRLGCIDLRTLMRAHSWIFRYKPLISNARILAQLGKFA